MTFADNFVILSVQKPPEGDPCNGCGMCCQEEACFLSRDFLNSEAAPCIALEFDGRRYLCGLVRNPTVYLPSDWFLRSHDKAARYITDEDWRRAALDESIIGGLFGDELGVGQGCYSDVKGR